MSARLVLAALALLAAGCSGLKTYPNDGPKNLHVATQTDRGVRAALHLHAVNGECTTHYDGTLALDHAALDVGVPAGRPTYLVVSFDTSSFMAGSRSTSVGTLLTARPGYEYQLAVRYKQDIYDIALREIDRKGVSRDLARRPLAGC
ncbi:MAG TPA: hypothetical protein VLI89_14515 [Burkholderiales bacterium]|jgi:hypothetical protein|nr:hypothetical protein [Burkholderiales bacterium]